MKRLISVLCALGALAAFGNAVYKAIPIFPYIDDIEVLASFFAFLIFYYIAFKMSKRDTSPETES
ncbi:MAG: hypothetical protein V4619_15635 [Bacteroidota bacterium]